MRVQWRRQVLEHPLFWNAETRMKLIDDVKEAFGCGAQLREAIDEGSSLRIPGQGNARGWDWERHWWSRNNGDWRLKKGIAADVFWSTSPVRGKKVSFVHLNGSRPYGQLGIFVSTRPLVHS